MRDVLWVGLIVIGEFIMFGLLLNTRRIAGHAVSKIDDLHVIVNDRLSQLLKRTEESSYLEGVTSERAEGAARAAEVAVAAAKVAAEVSVNDVAAAEARIPPVEGK